MKIIEACIFLCLLLTRYVTGLHAQPADKLSTFNRQLSTGRYFVTVDLPKDKPVVIIYFAPDCDHCHTLMNAFFQRVK